MFNKHSRAKIKRLLDSDLKKEWYVASLSLTVCLGLVASVSTLYYVFCIKI